MANVVQPQVIQQQHKGGGLLGSLFNLATPFVPAPWGAIGNAIFGGGSPGSAAQAVASSISSGDQQGGAGGDATGKPDVTGQVDTPASEDEKKKAEEEEKRKRAEALLDARDPRILDFAMGLL